MVPGGPLEGRGDASPREMAVTGASAPGQNPAYRRPVPPADGLGPAQSRVAITRFTVVAITIAPSRYEISACRSTIARIRESLIVVSETW
jgi:hypothetical protein